MKRTQIIESMIDEKWKSRRRFAEHIGIPPTTLQSILKRGVGNASIDNVIKICKGLGITIEQLEEMSKEEVNVIGEDLGTYETKDTSTCEYNYFPTAISAGLPLNVDGITEAEVISIPDTIMGKYAGNKDIFITRINGDSMNKTMPDGSLIAVRPVSLENLKNGDIVVYSNEYEYSVKYFYHDEEHKRYVFRPHSDDRVFADDIYSYDNAENLQIHGKVVLYIVELD